MDRKSKESRVSSDRKLMAGLEKHVGRSGSLVLRGKKIAMAEILKTLQERIDVAEPVPPAKAAWLALVRKERDVVEGSEDLVAAVRQYVLFTYGYDLETLADFGVTPKKRRALTSAEMADKAVKAKATREARHTLGPRQKQRIKGEAPAALPANAPADDGSRAPTT